MARCRKAGMVLRPTMAMPPCFMKYRRDKILGRFPSQQELVMFASLRVSRHSGRSDRQFPFLAEGISLIFVEIPANQAPILRPSPGPPARPARPTGLARLEDLSIASAMSLPSRARLGRRGKAARRGPAPDGNPKPNRNRPTRQHRRADTSEA